VGGVGNAQRSGALSKELGAAANSGASSGSAVHGSGTVHSSGGQRPQRDFRCRELDGCQVTIYA